MSEMTPQQMMGQLFSSNQQAIFVYEHWVEQYVNRSVHPNTTNEELRFIEAQRQFVLNIQRAVKSWLNRPV